MKDLKRRDFLKLMGVNSMAFLLGACFPQIEMEMAATAQPEAPAAILPDLEFKLTAAADSVQLFTGEATQVWRYHGEVLKGDASNLVNLEGSYLGPTFHVRQGQVVRIHFQNELAEPSIVHWHGLHVPVEADGHPHLVIPHGESYTYTFTVMDRAGSYWYHPHPHERTGPQVYAGLAGLFIVHDDEEDALTLPQGEFDLPLVLQDRIFSSDHQLYYGGSMMSHMDGFLGNQVLVNGMPDAQIALKAGTYRLRLLNGSNARVYQLAWDDGRPLVVIGTDGGLLETPIEKDAITLAPAQRIELWADFSAEAPGTSRKLVTLPHPAPGGNDLLPIVEFVFTDTADNPMTLPQQLTPTTWLQPDQATNAAQPRRFELAAGRGMHFTLNRRSFEMEAVTANEKVRLGDVERWEFENVSTGMEMGMMGNMDLPHPMHVHGLQFQIVERDWSKVDAQTWGSMAAAGVDDGWHDTVLVYPGEIVSILLRFSDYAGMYLYHCHNLEHEDMGMMRNYLVEG